jgi:hypothetical protein
MIAKIILSPLVMTGLVVVAVVIIIWRLLRLNRRDR